MFGGGGGAALIFKKRGWAIFQSGAYRGTSLIRNHRIIGPYSRPVSRVLGGGAVSYDRGTPVVAAAIRGVRVESGDLPLCS